MRFGSNLHSKFEASTIAVQPAAGRRRVCDATRRHKVMDIIVLGIGVAFFALALGYVTACDRL
jgi:hypothetical protein